jgi:hypothetical protein
VVDRASSFEVCERMLADGSVQTPLDPAAGYYSDRLCRATLRLPRLQAASIASRTR